MARRFFFLLIFAIAIAAAPLAIPRADDHLSDQEEIMQAALRPMTGDLDEMVERRMVRMAIPYNPIYFSYDGEKMIGIAVEIAREFEAFLREAHGVKIDVILMPLARDRIIPAVVEGKADIAAANLTITPEREALVAFSIPTIAKVSELVVTGPSAGQVSSLDDLVQTGLYLRPSSSYYGHLARLNAEREQAGKEPIPVTDADENLEDYDLLDLLHAGTIPAIVVDDHKLRLWTQVFENIVVHEELVINEGGEIAWAFRKDAPRLREAANSFLKGVREGTLVGNVILDRYLGNANWVEDIRSGVPLADFRAAVEVIKRYAGEYGFDWQMIVAQAYQESKLDQAKRSTAGAVGIMQILPSTAADPNVGVEDIDVMEHNVEAGVRYLRFLRDRYFDDPEMKQFDEVLFSLAAYNAGPANIARARKKAAAMGLDPNVWLSNVEVAAARAIGQEPVTYVRNIYKYSVALGLIGVYDTGAAVAAVAEEEKPEAGEPLPGLWVMGLAAACLLAGVMVFLFIRRRQSGS